MMQAEITAKDGRDNMRLQSAIFDMDGTLLNSMPAWDKVAVELLRRKGIEAEPDLNHEMMAMTSLQAAEYCKERFGLSETPEEWVAQVMDIMGEFYRTKVEAKPGVERMLSILKMEGVWMYVATATERPLAEAALKHAGIWEYFRGLITCTEAGGGKDMPVIYEKALRRLRSNKKDTVVFEDSLQAIRTAKAAGFRVAGVYDHSSLADQAAIKAESDYYIASFEDWTERRDAGFPPEG